MDRPPGLIGQAGVGGADQAEQGPLAGSERVYLVVVAVGCRRTPLCVGTVGRWRCSTRWSWEVVVKVSCDRGTEGWRGSQR